MEYLAATAGSHRLDAGGLDHFGPFLGFVGDELAEVEHPETHCYCPAAATPLALRWRCPVCGKSAIMMVSTLATVCDGETLTKVEPQPEAN
jgi:hypothetical protein